MSEHYFETRHMTRKEVEDRKSQPCKCGRRSDGILKLGDLFIPLCQRHAFRVSRLRIFNEARGRNGEIYNWFTPYDLLLNQVTEIKFKRFNCFKHL